MNEDSSAKDRALQLAIDEAKRRQDLNIAVYQANTTRLLEAVRAGNKAGSDALRAVTLLNGGAAVALLAFIGHLASLSAPQTTIVSLRYPLAVFVTGAFLAVFASAVNYFGQGFVTGQLSAEFAAMDEELSAEERKKAERRKEKFKTGFKVTNTFAILVGVFALAAFGLGCYKAYRAFDYLRSDRSAHCASIT